MFISYVTKLLVRQCTSGSVAALPLRGGPAQSRRVCKVCYLSWRCQGAKWGWRYIMQVANLSADYLVSTAFYASEWPLPMRQMM